MRLLWFELLGGEGSPRRSVNHLGYSEFFDSTNAVLLSDWRWWLYLSAVYG